MITFRRGKFSVSYLIQLNFTKLLPVLIERPMSSLQCPSWPELFHRNRQK